MVVLSSYLFDYSSIKIPKLTVAFSFFRVFILLIGRQILTGSNEIKRLSFKSFQNVQNIVPSLVIGTSKDATLLIITNIFHIQSIDFKSSILRVVFANFA